MGAVTQNGVQNGEQFAHTSHDRHLLLASLEQTLIHLPNDWIEANRCQGGHV